MFTRHLGLALLLTALHGAHAAGMNAQMESMPAGRDAAQSWRQGGEAGIGDASTPMPAIVPGAWQSLAGDAATRAFLNIVMAGMPMTELRSFVGLREIRSLPLPYYQGTLLEGRGWRDDGQPYSLYVVITAQGGAVLDGSSVPLHELNQTTPIQLRTENEAKAYLRLFTNAIQGEHGPFTIVESSAELWWKPGTDTEAARAPLDRKIRPLGLKRDGEDGWTAEATMVHGDTLFKTMLHVAASGMVKMLSDEPLQANLPVRRIRNDRAERREVCSETGCGQAAMVEREAVAAAWESAREAVLGFGQHLDAADPRQATLHFARLLEMVEAHFGADSPFLPEKLTWLGKRQKLGGDYPAAQATFEKALARYEKLRQRDDARVAATLDDLGRLYLETKQYAHAEATYGRMIQLQEVLLGSETEALAEALETLANLLEPRGIPEMARSLRQRADTIRKKNSGKALSMSNYS